MVKGILETLGVDERLEWCNSFVSVTKPGGNKDLHRFSKAEQGSNNWDIIYYALVCGHSIFLLWTVIYFYVGLTWIFDQTTCPRTNEYSL